jgi:hypothetical protein
VERVYKPHLHISLHYMQVNNMMILRAQRRARIGN